MAKVLAPPDMLKKLECSLCKCYLSVFPIYIRSDGNNPICGRCKVPNDEYLRDEAYEAIAQFLIFPCAEEKNGCIEQMRPLALKDHEHSCVSRKLDCPSKKITFCKWSGPNKDLLAHFVAMHNELVLANSKFEINFIRSTNEVMLMPFQDELFLIKKEMDSRTGTFICSCTQIFLKANPDKFNYYLRVVTRNLSNCHKFSERSTNPTWEERTKFTINEINDILNDPPAVIALIEIVKIATNYEENKNNENNKVEVDWEALRHLECPVCLGYFLGRIYQCSKGHSICDNCKNKMQVCPVCRGTIQETRNFVLEKYIAEHKDMMYPCKYYKAGCSLLKKPSEIQNHEKSCDYGPLDCPVSKEANCLQKFTKVEIMDHVDNNHDTFVLKTDKINIPFATASPFNRSFCKVYLIKFSNRLFKVGITYFCLLKDFFFNIILGILQVF